MRVAALFLVLQAVLFAAFPPPDGYVNDFADLLADKDEAYLENYLKTLERDTSAEVALVTVRSLDGMTIEEYASRLFAQWGIGKKQQDNGVLLLVAPEQRTVRIEVGYGLEPIIPDGLAGEIIRTVIIPEFKAGNLPRGIGRGVDRIAKIVRRDPAAVAAYQSEADASDDAPPAIAVVPFFGLFLGLAGFVAGLAVRTRTLGPLLWSGLFGLIPLVIATEFVSGPWIAVLMGFGACLAVMGHRSGGSPYWLGTLRDGEPASVYTDGPLAWVMGGRSGSSASDGSSGSDSSSSSSSSDFSGGSSGGGGASGRW